jgi:hypothetical protein
MNMDNLLTRALPQQRALKALSRIIERKKPV